MNSSLPKVVVLGGGNGKSRLLMGLLPFLHEKKIASLYALVHMSDDGGSTGRLQEQYQVAAMGDLTKCLLALSGLRGTVRGEAFLKALDYRYSSGDFQGHTLRNILLTTLQLTSDLDSALAMMARLLQSPKYTGVIPTTLTTLTEQVEILINGERRLLGEGQHFIAHQVNLQADPKWRPGDVRVTFKEKDIALNPRATKALRAATHIIVAPGHTYGSILPALALPDLGAAVRKSRAKLIVVMSLLTTPRQTNGWSGEDFITVYESYLGRGVETVVANSAPVPIDLVEGQEWIRFAQKKHAYTLIERPLVSAVAPDAQMGDTVPRALAIHDSRELGKVFHGILSGDGSSAPV
jgi:uncharacterized cofD-like protein